MSMVLSCGHWQPARMATALITGASRLAGIAPAVAMRLARDGWDVATAGEPGEEAAATAGVLSASIRGVGRRFAAVFGDLGDPTTPATLVSEVREQLGPINALIACHTHCLPSGLSTTTVESFDQHYAVNVRATWLLIEAFAEQVEPSEHGARIVTFTSDHTVGNLPYGATKAAADRITLAAAFDYAERGVRANVINPGPVDTGWMDDTVRAYALERTPVGRPATTDDPSDLVSFLCSPSGGWITGQLLHSNGGFKATIP
jgi:3-oxoacyl-[acyl-carrier protein] reductase